MNTESTVHIVNGDSAGDCLARSGLAGDILICRDLIYEGVRKPGWPDDATLLERGRLLEGLTGGGVEQAETVEMLRSFYSDLAFAAGQNVILWFDACLCDQAMLAHVLACLNQHGCRKAQLICVDSFHGVDDFNGLGQLSPDQLASLYAQRQEVSGAEFREALFADRAFASQDLRDLENIATRDDSPLPYLPAAARRWLEEQAEPGTGLGKLQTLSLEAIEEGVTRPGDIFRHVAARDTPPLYWGDITLWREINELASKEPPLVRIEGPGHKLPQWGDPSRLEKYRIFPA